MRILHCCLSAFYIDNYGYQENILPKMHKQLSHDVAILASTETYVDNKVLGYVEPGSYLTVDSIPITRVPYRKFLPHSIMKKLRIYKGISEFIKAFEPDIIFLHDCQFISIQKIELYAKNHPNVRIYVDGHTDFINSANNWLSKNILHGIVYKWCARKIEPYTRKFYGVLPARVDFFKSVYGIPAEKIELLVLGVDDSKLDLAKKDRIRSSIRNTLKIAESDFVVVTGGKIDERKNIHILMQAVNQINRKEIKLIVFGAPNDRMKRKIEELSEHESIRNIGWIASDKVYDYFMASDLAFFPGTHSVLWEQAIGAGLPCIFRNIDGIKHVDVGGNCLFIDSGDLKEIKRRIMEVYWNNELYSNMKQVAVDRGMSEFSYYKISKRAIED